MRLVRGDLEDRIGGGVADGLAGADMLQAKAGDEVSLSYIDDYGSIVTAPVIRIH